MPAFPVIACVQLAAPNDRNGNPRRLWLALHRHENYVGTQVHEEGYSGRPSACASEVDVGRVNISPGEYARIRKEAKAGGRYHPD